MKDLITIAAEEFIDKWNKIKPNEKPLQYIKNKFDLTGRVAGQFCWKGQAAWFRWNMPIAEENSDNYLTKTVGHEVAHWITHNLWPKAAAHGREWKYVMQTLGLAPTRCHNYTTKPARIVKRPYEYNCHCGQHHSFTVKKFQNIVLSGLTKTGASNYICNICKTPINVKQIKVVK